jgi:hypothetical protein
MVPSGVFRYSRWRDTVYLHPFSFLFLFFQNLHLFSGASVTHDWVTLGATLSHNHICT